MWRGKQHPHSRGRSVAALFCFSYFSSATVPGHGGGRAAGTGGNVACGCFKPGRAGHGCCAVLSLDSPGAGTGQTSSPGSSKSSLRIWMAFSSLQCRLLPALPSSLSHITLHSVFTVVSTLKENSLLRRVLLCCALLFWKAVFPLAKSTRVVPRGHVGVSSSFWPLPRGFWPPSPCSGGGSPA